MGGRPEQGREQEALMIHIFHVYFLKNWNSSLREGGMKWEVGTDIYALPCIKEIARTCYKAQEVQLGAL